jgi:hypothetical protein
MRHRMNVYFSDDTHNQIADKAARSRMARSAVVEAAVASYFSPDEKRQLMRLERNIGVTAETLALFIRFWLTITPPLDQDAHTSAQAKGRERFEGFIDTLARRLQSGDSFLNEIPGDVEADSGEPKLPTPGKA